MQGITGLFSVGVNYVWVPGDIKESIKRITGLFYFTVGVVTLASDVYGFYARYNQKDSEPISQAPSALDRRITQAAKISIYLCALTSPIGANLCGRAIQTIINPAQLEAWFGPNVNFAANPTHPRHVFSIMGTVLGIPAIIKETARWILWLKDRTSAPATTDGFLTNHRIQRMAAVVTTISRPALHIGNAISRRLR